MKKPLHIILLLLASNNIFIFIYGFFSLTDSFRSERAAMENLITDSALALAAHDRENNPIMPSLEKDFILQKTRSGYRLERLDNGSDFVRVYARQGKRQVYKDYIIPAKIKKTN
ncbi:MAG TPA: hypothetical protein P5511_03960 [Candidatus Goldiibacteriota bacterium]|nr:hypothetical protein [Candidatus Goldiibacteriota bacterium]